MAQRSGDKIQIHVDLDPDTEAGQAFGSIVDDYSSNAEAIRSVLRGEAAVDSGSGDGPALGETSISHFLTGTMLFALIVLVGQSLIIFGPTVAAGLTGLAALIVGGSAVLFGGG